MLDVISTRISKESCVGTVEPTTYQIMKPLVC